MLLELRRGKRKVGFFVRVVTSNSIRGDTHKKSVVLVVFPVSSLREAVKKLYEIVSFYYLTELYKILHNTHFIKPYRDPMYL